MDAYIDPEPLFLQIELTTRCNYTCRFCAGRHLPQRHMAPEVFRDVVDVSNRAIHYELQGEGEPMLHPRFFELLAYLRDRRPGAHISFITNGSFLGTDAAERLLDADIDRILVSIESPLPEEFRSIRGGDLEQVTAGIADFVAAKRNRSGPTTAIGFAATVFHGTVARIHGIAALYQRLGMDGGMIIQPLQRMPAYRRYYADDIAREIPTAADRMELRRRIAADRHLRRIVSTPPPRPGFYAELYRSIPPAEPLCPWLQHGLYITADGTAMTCCFVKDTERFGLARYDRASLPLIAARRRQPAGALVSGSIPEQCAGCSLAERITNGYRSAAT